MILNQHTVAEVRELIKAKDFEHSRIAKAFTAASDAQKSTDPSWAADWNAFMQRYANAKLKAVAIMGATPGSELTPNLAPAETAWGWMTSALTQDPSKPYTDKDDQGLYGRLIAMGISPDLSGLPQPTSKDVDLGLYNGAGDLQKAAAEAGARAKAAAALAAAVAEETAKRAAEAAAAAAKAAAEAAAAAIAAPGNKAADSFATFLNAVTWIAVGSAVVTVGIIGIKTFSSTNKGYAS